MKGPESGLSRPIPGWFKMAPAALAVLAGVVFVGVQYGLPSLRGPDAPYYLLGAQHLAAGDWPWGAEPPLAFMVFMPVFWLVGGQLAFVVASALWGALTVYSLGLLAREAWLALAGPKARAGEVAAAWAAALGTGYMFYCFVSGLFKNAVANVFMIIALRELFRRRWAAFALWCLLAWLSHPGAAATLVLAAGFAGAFMVAESGLRWIRECRADRLVACESPGRRLPLSAAPKPASAALILAGVVLALFLGRAVMPTFVRYFGTYLRGFDRPPPGKVFTWDSLSLISRYLPLWPLAAGSVRLYVGAPDRGQRLGLLTTTAWAGTLIAMASLGGLTARRFEIQLFIPVVTLASMRLTGFAEPGLSSLATPLKAGMRVLAVLAIVFGLVVQVGTIATSVPLLTAGQVAALAALDEYLPADAVLCVYMTDVRYWLEYMARRPVLSPDLLRERMELVGPVYVLAQNPTAYETHWSGETIASMRADGLILWEKESFFLLRARRDPEFLAAWTSPAQNDEVIRLLDGPVPAAHELPSYFPERPHGFDSAVGWVLFLPLGLARLAGLGPAPALVVGLPATAVLWLLLLDFVNRSRSQSRRLHPPAAS